MPALLIRACPRTGQTLSATLLGSLCPQRNHRSTSGLQPVSTLQRLTQSSPLSAFWATALRWAMLPSCSIGPQRLSRANAALTQLAHGCAAHSHGQTGHSPPATSTPAGQSLLLCWHLVLAPWCKQAPSRPHQLQLHYISVRPFSWSHIFTKESPH